MSFTFQESSNSLQHATKTQYMKAYVHAKLDNIITRHKDELETTTIPKLCSKMNKHKIGHGNDRTTPHKCPENPNPSRDIYQITNPNILQETISIVEQFKQSLEHYHKFPIPQSETRRGQFVNETFKRTGNPCPLVLPASLVEHIHHVSEVLHIGIQDTIRRWWTDEEAKLWERIPLDPKIAELLKWLADPLENPELSMYNTSGSWRPDFLIPDDGNGIHICEINSRFVMNGAAMTDQMQSYLLGSRESVQVDGRPMTSMANNLIGALDKTTQVDKPLFIVRGREPGYDINVYQHTYLGKSNKQLAKGTIIVHPGDLCTTSPFDSSEKKLFVNRQYTDVPCTSAQKDEYLEIDQLILELHQDELLSLPLPILKQIAKRTVFNDLRTIFLVHDKRMLGIIRQELPGLEERKILTNSQATLLSENIAETLIPSCSEYTTLYNVFERFPETRHDWLFKPAGRGKGEGIVFGANVDEKEWRRLLYPVNRQAHILQRRTKQRKYNLMMPKLEDEEGTRKVQWPLVGSFFIINGNFEGIMGWRASADDVCALSRDGKWMGGLVDGSV